MKDIKFGFLPSKRNIQWFREDLNGLNGKEGRFCACLTIAVNVVVGIVLTILICYLIAVKGWI